MAELVSLLRSNPALAAGSQAGLQTLARASVVRTFGLGDKVLRTGQPQTSVLLVCDGKLHLYRRNRKAERQILVGVLEPPAIFGDAESFGRAGRWMVSASAASALTTVWMPNEAFEAFVDTEAGAASVLYKDACARHLLSIQLVHIFALQRTPNQILRLLWSAGEPEADGSRVAPLSQAQLARALGIDPKTVARNLKELEDEGAITREGRRVKLAPSEELELWARLDRHGFGASWKLFRSRGEPDDVED